MMSFGCLLVFLVVVFNYIESSYAFLITNDVKYVVGIQPTSSTFSDVSPDRLISMRTANGQLVRCILPDANTPSLLENSESASRLVKDDDPAAVQLKMQRLHDIIQKLAQDVLTPSKGCLTRPFDYWTYDLCFFQHILQYHLDNGKMGLNFDVGAYVKGKDEIVENAYVQHYEASTGGRSAIVKFLCPPSSSTPGGPVPVLSSVREPKGLYYEFEVVADVVCKELPATIPTSKAPSNTPPGPLDSFPSSELRVEGESISPTTVMQALHSLRQQCLYKQENFWIYKFCFLDGIGQFHREMRVIPLSKQTTAATVAPGSKASTGDNNGNQAQPTHELETTNNYLLGCSPFAESESLVSSASGFSHSDIPTIREDLRWEDVSKITKVQGAEVNGKFRTIASQTYDHGTLCDLLDKAPRKTQVNYVCQDDVPSLFTDNELSNVKLKGAPYIASITEVSICRYEVVIAVPELCKHTDFAPKLSTVHEITCFLVEASAPNGDATIYTAHNNILMR